MIEGNIFLTLEQIVASVVFFCIEILVQNELIICYFYSLLIRLDFFHLWQELLYLYGFVIENNPDDYLMVMLSNTGALLCNLSSLSISYGLVWVSHWSTLTSSLHDKLGNWKRRCYFFLWEKEKKNELSGELAIHS